MGCQLAGALPVWINRKAGKLGYEHHADKGNAAARHELLHSLAFRTRVVVAVAFQEVDNTPDTKAGTECNNEGLKNINSRVKNSID